MITMGTMPFVQIALDLHKRHGTHGYLDDMCNHLASTGTVSVFVCVCGGGGGG